MYACFLISCSLADMHVAKQCNNGFNVSVKVAQQAAVDNSLLKQYIEGLYVFVEEFCSTIKQVHFEEPLHAGYKKTFEKVCTQDE